MTALMLFVLCYLLEEEPQLRTILMRRPISNIKLPFDMV
jgi:hypothetical protein